MAQPLKNITISAPAFKGLNTQDSPLSNDVQFSAVADNVVVDAFGRLGARKGLQKLTFNPDVLNGSSPTVIHEYEDANGTLTILSIADGKIFRGDTSLVDITPSGYTITDENFTFINFNDKCYIINKDHDPLVYDTTNGLRLVSDVSFASGTFPDGSVGIGGFGRLWVSDGNIVYWSDLLIGEIWDAGSAGSIDLDKVWPDGNDTVTGLAVWNSYLVIFGYNSIVLYRGAEDPATMSFADNISGVGCVDKNTIKAVGNDMLFMSARGLMALGRTIQEKSNPINDVSKNVRDDLLNLWQNETQGIRAVYSPVNSFYLMLFPTSNTIFCFDTRGYLENGGYRVTRWITGNHKCFYSRQDDTLLVGNTDGMSKYGGYLDNGQPYQMSYFSHPLSFGDPSIIKFLKKVAVTLIHGADITASVQWGYDFSQSYRAQSFTAKGQNPAYYDEDLYNSGALYSTGSEKVTTKRINTSGSGNLVTFGFQSMVDGSQLSIQEFNIQATSGRIY